MVDNRQSILNTIKPMVNVEVDDKNFDAVLIPFINGALTVITQLGVGPTSGFKIADETNLWPELLGIQTHGTKLVYIKWTTEPADTLLLEDGTSSILHVNDNVANQE